MFTVYLLIFLRKSLIIDLKAPFSHPDFHPEIQGAAHVINYYYKETL